MFSVDRERVLNIVFNALGIHAYMTVLIATPKNYITQTPRLPSTPFPLYLFRSCHGLKSVAPARYNFVDYYRVASIEIIDIGTKVSLIGETALEPGPKSDLALRSGCFSTEPPLQPLPHLW